jgi:hypothetical protein
MIPITVSTNYDDLLNIIIPQNYKFFEKWYIITDENDKNLTLEIFLKDSYAIGHDKKLVFQNSDRPRIDQDYPLRTLR